MNHEERQLIESKLRNILELHIHIQDVQYPIPLDYTTAIETKDKKRGMVILNLRDTQQFEFYMIFKNYLTNVKI